VSLTWLGVPRKTLPVDDGLCRSKSRPAVNGADPAHHASDGRA